MAILWDSVLAGATARVLRRRLVGGGTRAIHFHREERDLTLWGRDWTLVVRMHPQRGDLLLLPPGEPFSDARPLAGRVTDVRSLPDERILLLEVRRRRGPGVRTLVLEWIPTRWNALLVEGVVGGGADPETASPCTIRHLLQTRGGGNPQAPGLPYTTPEPSGRLGASAEPPGPFQWPGSGEGKEEERLLLRTLAWTSPLNLPTLADLPEEEARARWLRLRGVALEGGEMEPVVVEVRGSWTPYPLPVPGAERVEGDLLEAFHLAARRNDPEQADPGLSPVDPAVLSPLDRQIAGVEGRLRGLRRELERAPDPQVVRGRGDLLLARFREIPRGASSVTLQDFEGLEVEIDLDPALPPHRNAARLYDEAARMERARALLPERIRRSEERLAELNHLREEFLAGKVDGEAVLAGLPATARVGKREDAPGQAAPSLPYRSYRSSGGLEIRVGRGSSKNDDLTFRHSAPGDVWLHARESAGAHVILRWPGPGNPPARDLAEAAGLAALNSKARSAGSAPVDWTFRKYVRKPRKAPPGRVRVERARTIFVEPDPELPGRLSVDGSG